MLSNETIAIYDSVSPKMVVNAAAYTAVDSAENEPDLPLALNRDVPAQLAEWRNRDSALLVDYSTDYLFDGSSSAPYAEDDQTNPVNQYANQN